MLPADLLVQNFKFEYCSLILIIILRKRHYCNYNFILNKYRYRTAAIVIVFKIVAVAESPSGKVLRFVQKADSTKDIIQNIFARVPLKELLNYNYKVFHKDLFSVDP